MKKLLIPIVSILKYIILDTIAMSLILFSFAELFLIVFIFGAVNHIFAIIRLKFREHDEKNNLHSFFYTLYILVVPAVIIYVIGKPASDKVSDMIGFSFEGIFSIQFLILFSEYFIFHMYYEIKKYLISRKRNINGAIEIVKTKPKTIILFGIILLTAIIIYLSLLNI